VKRICDQRFNSHQHTVLDSSEPEKHCVLFSFWASNPPCNSYFQPPFTKLILFEFFGVPVRCFDIVVAVFFLFTLTKLKFPIASCRATA